MADTKPTRKLTRGKRDPNAPRGALSAYMFFTKVARAEIVKANPNASIGEIGKEMGAAWNRLNDAGKAPYVKQAEADKARYTKEMAAYTPKA
ncbi:hypothetical protein [Streptomyces sp. NPDC056883]|uniref:hypothetical protein n=1 Tax=Streptomyces sp. NPDC056883 TaxID=3345959 RepID=UPI0036C6DD33